MGLAYNTPLLGVKNYADIAVDSSILMQGLTTATHHRYGVLTNNGTPIVVTDGIYDLSFAAQAGAIAPYLNKSYVYAMKSTADFNNPNLGTDAYQVEMFDLPLVATEFRFNLTYGDSYCFVFYAEYPGSQLDGEVSISSTTINSIVENPDTWENITLAALPSPLTVTSADGNVLLSDPISAGTGIQYRYSIQIQNLTAAPQTIQVNIVDGSDNVIDYTEHIISASATQTVSIVSDSYTHASTTYFAIATSDPTGISISNVVVETLTADGGETATPITCDASYTVSNTANTDATELAYNGTPIVLESETAYRLTLSAVRSDLSELYYSSDIFIAASPSGTRLWSLLVNIQSEEEYAFDENITTIEIPEIVSAVPLYLYLDAGVGGSNFNKDADYRHLTLKEKNVAATEVAIQPGREYTLTVNAVKNTDSTSEQYANVSGDFGGGNTFSENIPIYSGTVGQPSTITFTIPSDSLTPNIYFSPSVTGGLNSVDFNPIAVTYIDEVPMVSKDIRVMTVCLKADVSEGFYINKETI